MIINQTGGGGLEINGIINQYKAAAGENISAGDFVEFINDFNPAQRITTDGYSQFAEGSRIGMVATSMTEDTILITCTNAATNSWYPRAILIRVSGTTITAGTMTQISSDVSNTSCTVAPYKITDTKALITGSTASGLIRACVATINLSTLSITVGTWTSVESSINLSASSGGAVLTSESTGYYFGGSGGCLAALPISISTSNNTVSFGTLITVEFSMYTRNASPMYKPVKLDATHVMLVYRSSTSDYSGYNSLSTCILTLSGSDITKGTTRLMCSDYDYNYPCRISITEAFDNSVLIMYIKTSGSYAQLALIKYSTAYEITGVYRTTVDSNSCIRASISCVDSASKKFLLCVDRNANTVGQLLIPISISGTTITVEASCIYQNAIKYYGSTITRAVNQPLMLYNFTATGNNSSAGDIGVGVVDVPWTRIKPVETVINGVAKTDGSAEILIDVYEPEN